MGMFLKRWFEEARWPRTICSLEKYFNLKWPMPWEDDHSVDGELGPKRIKDGVIA